MTLKQENQRLRKIVTDLHFLARRYCDGRKTYVTRMFNEYTRELLKLGIPLNSTAHETIWARDGMGRAYDGLTDEEAAQGETTHE